MAHYDNFRDQLGIKYSEQDTLPQARTQAKDVDEKVQSVDKDVQGVSLQVQDENVKMVNDKAQNVIDGAKITLG
jgi:hypothetical protein